MGRKKIHIARISEERNRQITFSKRKHGLLKKAYELSILCDVEVAIIIIGGGHQRLYQYASSNINEILMKYTEIQEPFESKTNADVHDDISRKESKQTNDSISPDEDCDDSQYVGSGGSYTMPPAKTYPSVSHSPVLNPGMPPAMPVAVPVSSPKTSISSEGGSAGSTGSFDSPKIPQPTLPPLGVPMPPPRLPPRVQSIRNSHLKLHLPGGQTIKLNPPDAAKMPKTSTVGDALAEMTEGPDKRPKLTVVTPGMKDYSPRNILPSSMLSPSILSSLLSQGQGQLDASGNLTIPLPLDTPGMNLSTPGISSLLHDINLPSAPNQEALITFPVNFQNLQTSQGPGAVKFGPPILVTPQPSAVDNPPVFTTTTTQAPNQPSEEMVDGGGFTMFKRQQSLEMVQQLLQLHQQMLQQQHQGLAQEGGDTGPPPDLPLTDEESTPMAKRRRQSPPP
jgi:MADS-box transcription enhancer factor 2D